MKFLKKVKKIIAEKVESIMNSIKEAIKTATYSKENLLVKIATFAFIFVATTFIKFSYNNCTPMQLIGVIIGCYSFGIVGLFAIFQPNSANSAIRYVNEPVYDLISIIWSYPLAIIVAIITLAIFGTAQPLLITVMVTGIKFVINLLIKKQVVDANELYIHSI